MFDERYGRHPLGYANPPFTDGITGKSHSAFDMKDRVEHLARALSKELGFKPDEGTEWDKVVGCFSLNTIDYMTLVWAVHRLGGIVSACNAAYNSEELEYQVKSSGCKAIFTALPLLKTCTKGVESSNISKEKIFILPLAEQYEKGFENTGHKTIDDLIKEG